MTLLNKPNLLIFYIISMVITHSITTTVTKASILEFEINDVVDKFIGQDIRNNETLLKEVKMAIENVLFQKERQELEHRSKADLDTISGKFMNEYKIRNKLETFFRALSIYKAATLLDSIEEKLRPKDPDFCEHCLKWGHQETNCTNEKPEFFNLLLDEYFQESLQKRRNYWWWTLEHRQDHVDIKRLSDYLEQDVYHEPNFSTIFNFTADQKPASIEQFKMIFGFGLAEILQERNYLESNYHNEAYLKDFKIEEISVQKYIEIFLKALDKWVDFEEPFFQQYDDNSIEGITTKSQLEPDIEKVVNKFIGRDTIGNETLLHEVKIAIKHVLLQMQSLQGRIEATRRKIEMEEKRIDLYKTKIKTFSKALRIYNLAARLQKPNCESDEQEKPPLCSNCLGWNHTADKCNSSNVITYGSNVSITGDVYYFYRKIVKKNDYGLTFTWLFKKLQEEYDGGNFTNRLIPKPENFPRFKLICCEALAKIQQFVHYLATSYRNEPQMKQVDHCGVPLIDYVMFFLKQLIYPHQLVE